MKEVIDALLEGVRQPVPIAIGNPLAVPHGYELKSLEHLRDTPDRQRGEIELQTLASLLEYGSNHAVSGTSAVFADQEGSAVSVVLNWHAGETDAGWGDHTAVYRLKFSPEWAAWAGINGRALSQKAFGEFLEEWSGNVIEPEPAALLEAVMKLSGKRNITFESSRRLDNGDTAIVWKEETTAGGAQQGDAAFPSRFTISVPVYRGAEQATTFAVQALLRYRLDEGKLTYEVKLLQVDNIRDLAFGELLASIQASVAAWVTQDVPVYVGKITSRPKAA